MRFPRRAWNSPNVATRSWSRNSPLGVSAAAARDDDPRETAEWLQSLDYVCQVEGPQRAIPAGETERAGLSTRRALPVRRHHRLISTPSRPAQQPDYPGDREIERKIKSIIRWNAMAMVVRANKLSPGIGGHISTFASAATLYEVAFNHFFHGKQGTHPPDQVFFQGHAAPGIYARAFLLGRLSEQQLKNFRRELAARRRDCRRIPIPG